MKRYLFPLLGLALIVSLSLPLAAPVGAQANDPGTLLKSFLTALNKGDAAAATALFTDDAAVKASDDPKDNYQGKQAIQSWIEGGIGGKVQIQLEGDPKVAGTQATGMDKEIVPELTQAGIDFLEQNFVVTTDNGKIKTLTLSLTADSQAKLAKLGAPPAAPATGEGGAASTQLTSPATSFPWLIVLGGLVVVASLSAVVYQHRNRRS